VVEFVFPHLEGICSAYDRDGYAIVRQVLDDQLLEELNRHIDWLIEHHPELEPERLGHQLVADDPFWVRFLSAPNLLDVAEALVGPNIALFAADYICKPPGTGKGVQWHQDGRYWPLQPMEVVTAWFAVTESVPENGGVRVIPGSHRLGLQKHDPLREEHLLLNKVDPAALDESKAIDLELAAGDISVHHPLLLHGSEPNRSNRWRRGGSIQYMPATTLVTKRDWPCLFLFRGEPVDGINQYRSNPSFRADPHMAFRSCEAWQGASREKSS
jgi:phytanoyl-CoA hydroxylase